MFPFHKLLMTVRPIVLVVTVFFFGAFVGCDPPTSTVPAKVDETVPAPVDQPPLRLLVVDDTPLSDAIQSQWQSLTGQALEISSLTSTELAAAKTPPVADGIIFPCALLGTVAENGWLTSLPDDAMNESKFDRRDVFELIQRRETVWGQKTYGVPLGSPLFVLMYRRDIFEQLKLQPPTTWQEYQQVAQRLTDRAAIGDLAPPEAEPWYGSLEPLAPGWAGQLLLARAAAYARHRSQYSALFDYRSMEPLIAGAPFVKGLDELAAAAKLGNPAAHGFTPAEVSREFLAGHCAMAIAWPPRTTTAATEGPVAGSASMAAGFAPLPGSAEAFNFRERKWEKRPKDEDHHVPLLATSGRMGGVMKDSRRGRSVLHLFLTIASKDLSTTIIPHTSAATMFRHSHLKQSSDWLDARIDETGAKQYGETLQAETGRSTWLFSPRLPGRDRYLIALDEAVSAAVRGDEKSAALLSVVAESWKKITDERGLKEQQIAYRRCLGLDQ